MVTTTLLQSEANAVDRIERGDTVFVHAYDGRYFPAHVTAVSDKGDFHAASTSPGAITCTTRFTVKSPLSFPSDVRAGWDAPRTVHCGSGGAILDTPADAAVLTEGLPILLRHRLLSESIYVMEVAASREAQVAALTRSPAEELRDGAAAVPNGYLGGALDADIFDILDSDADGDQRVAVLHDWRGVAVWEDALVHELRTAPDGSLTLDALLIADGTVVRNVLLDDVRTAALPAQLIAIARARHVDKDEMLQSTRKVPQRGQGMRELTQRQLEALIQRSDAGATGDASWMDSLRGATQTTQAGGSAMQAPAPTHGQALDAVAEEGGVALSDAERYELGVAIPDLHRYPSLVIDPHNPLRLATYDELCSSSGVPLHAELSHICGRPVFAVPPSFAAAGVASGLGFGFDVSVMVFEPHAGRAACAMVPAEAEGDGRLVVEPFEMVQRDVQTAATAEARAKLQRRDAHKDVVTASAGADTNLVSLLSVGTSVWAHAPPRALLRYNPLLAIAEQAVQAQNKFADPSFAPSLTSFIGPLAVGPLMRGEVTLADLFPTLAPPPGSIITWRRASELSRSASPAMSPADVLRLDEGCCTPPWMPAAIAAASLSPEFDDVISPRVASEHGIYVVRIIVDGLAHFVAVDDFLPCIAFPAESVPGGAARQRRRTARGYDDIDVDHTVRVADEQPQQLVVVPVCLQSHTAGCIGPSLIEKAYAKLEGSYAALGGRDLHPYLLATARSAFNVSKVFEDLSGGVALPLDMPMAAAVRAARLAADARQREVTRGPFGASRAAALSTTPPSRAAGAPPSGAARLAFLSEGDSRAHTLGTAALAAAADRNVYRGIQLVAAAFAGTPVQRAAICAAVAPTDQYLVMRRAEVRSSGITGAGGGEVSDVVHPSTGAPYTIAFDLVNGTDGGSSRLGIVPAPYPQDDGSSVIDSGRGRDAKLALARKPPRVSVKDWRTDGVARPSVGGVTPDADGVVAGTPWGDEFDMRFVPVESVATGHDAGVTLANCPSWGRVSVSGSYAHPAVEATSRALEAAWRGGQRDAQQHDQGLVGSSLSAGAQSLGVRLRGFDLAPLAGSHGFHGSAFFYLQLSHTASVRISAGPPDPRFDVPRQDGVFTVSVFSVKASSSANSDFITPTLVSGTPPYFLSRDRRVVQGWDVGTRDQHHNFPPSGATLLDSLAGGRYLILVRFQVADAALSPSSIDQPFVLRVWCKDQFFLRPTFW